MSTQTENLHLVKPADGEIADIGVINSNMDIIDEAVSDCLPLSGGTLTGGVDVKRSNIDMKASNNGVTSEIWLSALRDLDTNGYNIGFLGTYAHPNGTMGYEIHAYNRNTSGTQVAHNYITLRTDKSGNSTYGVASPANFRSAIGMGGTGTNLYQDVSTAVSVPTATGKAIASLSLAAGQWVVHGCVNFVSNATGRRMVNLSTVSGDASGASSRQSWVMVNATSGASTHLMSVFDYNVGSTTTVYLNAWQNSGGALNCTGLIRALRVI